MRSVATYIGEKSSDHRPRSRSIGVLWNGLNAAAFDTRRQKSCIAERAPSRPPTIIPCAKTAAFIAPADVPDMPSISSHGSSRRRSRTPHVNAPCEPPPCNARSISKGARELPGPSATGNIAGTVSGGSPSGMSVFRRGEGAVRIRVSKDCQGSRFNSKRHGCRVVSCPLVGA